jgi:GT2 family glycosyltransferase
MPQSNKKIGPAHRAARESAAQVGLLGTTWLSDNTLLMVGSGGLDGDRIAKASLSFGDSNVDLDIRLTTYLASESVTSDSRMRWVMVARGGGQIRNGSQFGLKFASDQTTWDVAGESVRASLTDLQAFIRRHFAPLEASQRAHIVSFLALSSEEAASDEWTERIRLSRSLHLVREMLRERLPICELDANRIEGLSLEAVMALDKVSFYIEGWMCDVESNAVRLTAVSPEGIRTEVANRLFRYRRPDAEQFFRAAIGDQPSASYGFISYFKIAAPSVLPSGWLLEMETAAGTVMEARAPRAITDFKDITADLLGDLGHDVGSNPELRRHHISPALMTVQAVRSNRVKVEHLVEFGRQPANPQVSVIVPLYGRVDLLEHQLVSFADDPDMHSNELIYVLDSPEIGKELLGMAERLFRLYRLPFRVAVLSENAGFSTANNVAASFARGQFLLLLNSDVLPREKGWLSKMAAFYNQLEHPGAVGPKLVYEDDSLQHAGLYFVRPEGSRVWTNEHYFKGLHGDLPMANVARRVPAVTAACLLIDRHLFRSIGGLSGAYLQGDYEDSDLCLRLLESGRDNWYFPGVDLYHLEAQSYPSATRSINRQYNRWLFNEIWAEVIERTLARPELQVPQAPINSTPVENHGAARAGRREANRPAMSQSTEGEVTSVHAPVAMRSDGPSRSRASLSNQDFVAPRDALSDPNA